MAHEADNLVLVQLREIRATLAEHSVQFTMIRERFDQIDKRFEDFHALTSHTQMLGTSNSLKSHDLEPRYEFSEGEQRRLRERMDELEIRLSKVERKMDD